MTGVSSPALERGVGAWLQEPVVAAGGDQAVRREGQDGAADQGRRLVLLQEGGPPLGRDPVAVDDRVAEAEPRTAGVSASSQARR